MVHRALTSEEVQVRNWLLSGKSVTWTASKLSIGKSKVNKIIDNLIVFGELVEDYYIENGRPKAYNPRLFRVPSDSIKTTKADPPKGGSEKRTAEKEAPFASMRGRTAPPSLETHGISVAKECPDGFAEAHLDGTFAYTVNAVGEMDRIADPEGYTLGYVSDEVKKVLRSGLQRRGSLRMFGQEVAFSYRWFPSTGSQYLYLSPGRLYYDPSVYTTKAEIMDLFRQRAEYIEYALAINGWVLTPNENFNGRLHIAWENHPLCKHFDIEQYDPNADLIVDTSKGQPELEMEHSEDPLFNEKLRIMSNLPTRIMDIESKAASQEISTQQLFEELHGLRAVMDEMISTMAVMSRAQQMQLDFSARQVQISANLLKVQSNDTNAQMMRTQMSLDSFAEASQQTAKAHPKETAVHPLEGYQ